MLYGTDDRYLTKSKQGHSLRLKRMSNGDTNLRARMDWLNQPTFNLGEWTPDDLERLGLEMIKMAERARQAAITEEMAAA
jgi:hypothetical protein